jgi:aspartate dehydrogenase
MNLGIIGCGAIGTDVAEAANNLDKISKIFLYDINLNSSKILSKKIKKSKISDIGEIIDYADVVFEGASQQAVHDYAEKILEAGKDLILMSIGGLVEDAFRNKLERIALKNNCKIYIPSGAIFGIDGLFSASIGGLDEVTLVTTKPPSSFGKKIEKRKVLFEGTARDAIKKYPKNINVAASVSLAGIGFDDTMVEIVADPVATRIHHKILAHGKFGRLRAEVENMPNPKNPKSSYLASLSAISTLKKIINPIQVGS